MNNWESLSLFKNQPMHVSDTCLNFIGITRQKGTEVIKQNKNKFTSTFLPHTVLSIYKALNFFKSLKWHMLMWSEEVRWNGGKHYDKQKEAQIQTFNES